MLIQSEPGTFEKLEKLSGMATDNVLARPQDTKSYAVVRPPYSRPEKNPLPGVYKASMPNGKTINLFRTMFTDFCKMDCHFCPNSHWVPRKRFSFKVDELARTFHEMEQRHMVAGMFLSSGVAGSGSKTTDKRIKVVDLIRNKYKFNGYIHLKVIPGTEYQYVEEAHRLGTRLSVNLETPTIAGMKKLSKMKDLERDMLPQMNWMDNLLKQRSPDGAVGQATQLVVGAADESDWDIYERMVQLYGQWNFKRVYYNPLMPIRYTPLEDHEPTPMWRTNRLYQVDWLKRIYGFADDEIKLAHDPAGFLPLEDDPKTAIALAERGQVPDQPQRS
jgi:predicted DNA-binding helix-hairpin-helix protein